MTVEPEIVYGSWYRAESSNGIDFYPANCFTRAEIKAFYSRYPNNSLTIKRIKGYGARLQMPGCLDSTDWSVFKTEDEARNYLIEFYDVDPSEL
jgi:hypothetical protein